MVAYVRLLIFTKERVLNVSQIDREMEHSRRRGIAREHWSKLMTKKWEMCTCKCSSRHGWPGKWGASLPMFLIPVNFSSAIFWRSSNVSVGAHNFKIYAPKTQSFRLIKSISHYKCFWLPMVEEPSGFTSLSAWHEIIKYQSICYKLRTWCKCLQSTLPLP